MSRPPLLHPRFEGIPEELKALAQWLVWEAVWKDDPNKPSGGRWSKEPYNAVTGAGLLHRPSDLDFF